MNMKWSSAIFKIKILNDFIRCENNNFIKKKRENHEKKKKKNN